MARTWHVDGGIEVSIVRDGEGPLVAALIDEASVWLESRGLQQWPRPFPEEWLDEQLARGSAYLARDGGVPVATFTLWREDEIFWGDEGRSGRAYYLHRLAVRRTHRGLGRTLVGLAEQLTAEAGREFLRLDCVAANPGIRRYYEALGFEHRGDVDVPSRGWRASLYEKRIG